MTPQCDLRQQQQEEPDHDVTHGKREEETRYEYLSPSELLERLRKKAILYLPIGSLEWHNEHLPLGTDSFHAVEICLRLCARIGGVVLPCFCWNTGGVYEHPVTYHMPEEHYRSVLRNVILGLKALPAKLLVTVNGHGGEFQKQSTGVVGRLLDEECFKLKLVDATPYLVASGHPRMIDHADTNETSAAMELIPELVRLDRSITPDLRSGKMPFTSKGQPRAEYGREFWECYQSKAVELISAAYSQLAGLPQVNDP